MIDTARSKFVFTNDLLTIKKHSVMGGEEDEIEVQEVPEPVGTIIVTPGGCGKAPRGAGTGEATPKGRNDSS